MRTIPLMVLAAAILVAASSPPARAAATEGAGEGFTAELGLGGGNVGLAERGGIRHDASAFVFHAGIGAFVNPRAAVGVLLEGAGSVDEEGAIESTIGTGWFGLRFQWFPHDRWSLGAGIGSMAVTAERQPDDVEDELQGLGLMVEASWIFARTTEHAHHLRVAFTGGAVTEEDADDFDGVRTLFVGYAWQKR